MGLFSFLGRQLVRPYTRVFKDVAKSTQNISESVSQLKTLKEQKEAQVKYIDAKDAKEAFEKIAQAGNWTEEELEQQAVVMKHAKWFFLFGLILSVFMFFVLGWIIEQLWMMSIVAGSMALIAATCGATALRYAIYQAQLTDRELYSFNEFMGKPDFWRRLFL